MFRKLFFFLLCWPALALTQPVIDTAGDTCHAQAAGASSISFSCTASGANRLALIGATNWSGIAVTSETYGAATPVSVASTSGDVVDLRRVIAPAVGTQTVQITWGSATDSAAGVVLFTNAHQTTPLGTPVTNIGNTSPVTVNVSSAANEIVVDVVGPFQSVNLDVGAGQTERWHEVFNTDKHGAMSTETGAATTTMSWALTGTDGWGIAAVPVKPAAAVVSGRKARAQVFQ